jgi:hypothetical protein
MHRTLAIFVALVLCAGMLHAQQTAAIADLSLETTGYGFHIQPLATSVADGFVIFYAHYDAGVWRLRSRLLRSDATLGPAYTLATNLDTGLWLPFQAAWHPQTNSFLVVYRKGSALKARRVKANGSPGGAEKNIGPYTRDFYALTWVSKKKFVLFLERSGEITGQVLRKLGKKKGKEKMILSFTQGEAIPLDAATDNNGIAALALANYNNSSNSSDIHVLTVDRKLRTQNVALMLSGYTTNGDNALRYVHLAHDTFNDAFAMAWRIAPAAAGYCTFDSEGTFISDPADLPVDATIRELRFFPADGSFAAYYYVIADFGGTESTEFYITIFFANGTIDTNFQLLLRVTGEVDGWGFGISNLDAVFAGWVPETTPPGVHGRMIY